MLDGDIPWEIKDVKDRIPRLIGEAEQEYFVRLQQEQLKNSSEVRGYLDNDF